MGYVWEEITVHAVLVPLPQGRKDRPKTTADSMVNIYKNGLLYYEHFDAELEDSAKVAPHTWVISVYTNNHSPLGWSDDMYRRASEETLNYMKRHIHQNHGEKIEGLTLEEVRRRLITIDKEGTLSTEMALLVPKIDEWGNQDTVEDLAKFLVNKIYATRVDN